MVQRRLTIALPDDLPNPAYAALVRGVQGVLHAAGVSARATIHPDSFITDAELNAAYSKAAEFDPWAP